MTDRREVIFHIIERGIAWFYRQYAKELQPEDVRSYEQAEPAAREEKVGLWADPSPTPPWDFRHGTRTARAPVKAPGSKPSTSAIGPIIGNRASKIYHLPNCPDYSKVSERNRASFKTEAEAQAAGYRKARNCSQ